MGCPRYYGTRVTVNYFVASYTVIRFQILLLQLTDKTVLFQIKTKEEKEKEERLEGQKILIELMEADRIYQELEKDKIHRNYCANLKLQEAHVAQIVSIDITILGKYFNSVQS